ncbi:serine/threonine protein kinase, partial [Bifidobacterium italicum]
VGRRRRHRVGGYTLDARLGAGAMGSVWRVTDGGGTSYAMKILRDSLNDEAADAEGRRAQTTARERLRREAMALKRIKDPGVCSIVDMELDDSLAFIVTELIEGDNLRQDVAQNGRYVGSDLERLAEKLIAAVHAVHAAGIVHRDIKPTNVMVSVTGPILVDFGIAMGEGESHVTSTGLVMGTPGFIAPEIIEGQEATEATDWWSAASVLAFAATGAPVFGTQPMLAVLQREAAGNANLQGLPPRTLQAFRAALSPHPEERCTPDELLDAISADAWEAESHLPFEPAAPATGATFRKNESVNNPRTLWRAQSMPTASILFPGGRPRAAAPSDEGGRSGDGMRTHGDVSLDPPRPPTATRPLTAATTSLRPPAATPAPAATRMLPTNADTAAADAEATQVIGPIEQPTVALTAMHDATAQGAMTQAAAQPTMTRSAAEPGQDATQALRPATSAPSWRTVRTQEGVQSPQPQSDMQPQQQAPQMYAQPAFAQPPQDATPYYAARGRLACLLPLAPLAALAASLPVVAPIVASAMLWMLMAVGYNADAQTARIRRRQGARRGSDAAVRAISFPWHLLKSIVLVIPATLALWLADALVVALATFVCRLPCYETPLPLLGGSLTVAVPDAAPASPTGASCAIAFAVGWLLAALGPWSSPIRLGAGHLLGLTRREREHAQLPPRHNRWQWVWLALAVIGVCAAAINIEVSPAVAWWPLLPW